MLVYTMRGRPWRDGIGLSQKFANGVALVSSPVAALCLTETKGLRVESEDEPGVAPTGLPSGLRVAAGDELSAQELAQLSWASQFWPS